MLSITADLLVRATGCTRGSALTWAKPLAEACALYEITTPARLAAFLAQVGHESRGLTRTVENLNYRADRIRELAEESKPGTRWRSLLGREKALAMNPPAFAEAVYGGRMGNSQPGDGYRFRGRGLIQVTGRANYEAVRDQLRERVKAVPDLLAMPEVLAEPKWAALSAAAYWHEHRLNELADTGRFDDITRRINGGTTGMADRQKRYERARKALAP